MIHFNYLVGEAVLAAAAFWGPCWLAAAAAGETRECKGAVNGALRGGGGAAAARRRGGGRGEGARKQPQLPCRNLLPQNDPLD